MNPKQRKWARRITVKEEEEVKDKVIQFRTTSENCRKIKKAAVTKRCTMSYLIEECLKKYKIL